MLFGGFLWLAKLSEVRDQAVLQQVAAALAADVRDAPQAVTRLPERDVWIGRARWLGAYLASQLLFLGALQQVGRATRRLSDAHEKALLAEQRTLLRQRNSLAVLNEIASLRHFDPEGRLTEALQLAATHVAVDMAALLPVDPRWPLARIAWQPDTQPVHTALEAAVRTLPVDELMVHRVDLPGASDIAETAVALAVPVWVAGAPMAWLMLAVGARDRSFDAVDDDFIALLANWMGGVGEKLQQQSSREALLRRLEQLTTHVPGAVFEFRMSPGEAPRLAYISPGALDVLGEAPWSLTTQLNGLHNRVHEADRASLESGFLRGESPGASVAIEFRYHHPQRGEVWLRVEASPHRDDHDQLSWYGVVLDVSQRKQIEAQVASVYDEVRTARAETDALIDSAVGTVIMVSNANGRIVRYNHTAEALTGRPVEAVVDFMSPFDLVAGLEPGLDAEILAALEPGASLRFECRLLHADGSDLPARGVVTALVPDPQGHADGRYLWVLTDISELAEALHATREAAARLLTVTDSAPVLIGQLDRAGRHVFCNRVYAEWWGTTPQAVLGQTVAQALGTEAGAAMHAPVEAVLSGAPVQVVNAPLAGRWLEIRYVPHRTDDRVVGLFVVAVDVSERMQHEARQKAFISTVSHELRTPLTAINGVLGLVNGGVLGEVSAEMAEMLQMAEQNGKRLAGLVNDLLDLDKIADGKLTVKPERLLLSAALREAVALNRAYADTCDVRIELSDLPGVAVRADAQRVQQVMANLISNAAKFSPPGSTITVSADADGNRATVRVQDQGDGIPALFRARVFEKFAQADGSDRRTSHGSGLGLPIAKDLVELMGGQIGFESEEGRGTCFWFSLPLIGEAS